MYHRFLDGREAAQNWVIGALGRGEGSAAASAESAGTAANAIMMPDRRHIAWSPVVAASGEFPLAADRRAKIAVGGA